jgi:hypothetical protein
LNARSPIPNFLNTPWLANGLLTGHGLAFMDEAGAGQRLEPAAIGPIHRAADRYWAGGRYLMT